MDRYEKLLRTIVSQTESGQLKWHIKSPGECSEKIFNPDFVYQAYGADYLLNGKMYRIILVQRKDAKTDHDWDMIIDVYSVEVLILLGAKLIATLDENHVEKTDLYKLAALVEEVNKESDEFFKSL